MTGFLEIVVIAFGAQLAVLPGEKVQFIIAGLATKYHPLLVVSAAGSAFAGWTALEIIFGSAIQDAFSPVILDTIAAGLFLLFAVMLVRSAPEDGEVDPETDHDIRTETDGGVQDKDETIDVSLLGYEVPDYFGGFLPIFTLMAVGEFGDKTQLVTIGLAIEYGATSAIWIGEMLAIIPVSLVNAYFFHRFSHSFDVRKAHYAGAAIFAFFGADTLLSVVTGFSIWETVVNEISEVLFATLAVV